MMNSSIILQRRMICCCKKNEIRQQQQQQQKLLRQVPRTITSLSSRWLSSSSRWLSTSSSSQQQHQNLYHYDKYLSQISKLRKPSAIRKLQPLVTKPNMISLGGGLPNPNLFPIEGLSFRLQQTNNNNSSKDDDNNNNNDSTSASSIVELTQHELNLALQYSQTNGIPVLREQLIQLQKGEHGTRGWGDEDEDHHGNDDSVMDLTITVGSQDGFCKAIEMLIDPPGCEESSKNDGDTIFLESPTYSGALSFLHPFGAKLVPVLTDENGMIPSKLEEAIEKSSLSSSSSHTMTTRPKGVIYIIPTAQNPSGVTLSQQRRMEIYKLATKYELIILEDDPYYFLHPNRHKYDSFLSIENNIVDDGSIRRVIRFDSFSKLISSGLRLGMVSGPKQLIDKLNLHIQATNLHNSGLSQVVLSKILHEWGDVGFNNHCQQVSDFYCQRRDVMVKACQRHLLTEGGEEDLVEFNIPEAGMFLWMKLNNINNSKLLIEEKASKANILLVPGQSFLPISSSSSSQYDDNNNDHDDSQHPISPYVRASFSTATDEEIDIAMKRLASLLKSERGGFN